MTGATLAFIPPFGWEDLLGFLRARAIPGVEDVAEDRYRRTVQVDRARAVIEVHRGSSATLEVRLHSLSKRRAGEALLLRVRHLFDLDADPRVINRTLKADPVLAASLAAAPGLRVPGAWDGFEIGVRAILGQQVTVKGASTLIGRLVAQFGKPLPKALRDQRLQAVFPSAGDLARVDAATIATIGLPGARARSLAAFARAVDVRRIRFDGTMTAQDFYDAMLAIKGIGPWTAQYVAMRAHHDADAFPSGDLALQRVLAPPGESLRVPELVARVEAWRPWRAYGAMHLWRAYA